MMAPVSTRAPRRRDMNISRTLAWLMLAGILIAPAAAQAPRGAQGQRAARTTDGKPNLNGIWQALGTANWEIQDHPAYSGPMWELGAIGAVPAGQGVMEGNEWSRQPISMTGQAPAAVSSVTPRS